MMITEIKLQGDTTEQYTVSVDGNGSASCSCPSYRYKRATEVKWCKHLEFVVATVGAFSG